MPLSAATSAREILTGLHGVMARRGSAQAKLDHVVDLIAESMKSEVCSIYLLREAVLELFATHGLNKEAVHVTRLALNQGLVGTIAAEERILNLAEASSHPAFAYRPETGEEAFHSFAGVPIIFRERAHPSSCRRVHTQLRLIRTRRILTHPFTRSTRMRSCLTASRSAECPIHHHQNPPIPSSRTSTRCCRRRRSTRIMP